MDRECRDELQNKTFSKLVTDKLQYFPLTPSISEIKSKYIQLYAQFVIHRTENL